MAKSRLSVRNGAVSLPSGYALDSQSMRIRESQNSEDVTIYGSNVYGASAGTGTPYQTATVVGFPFAHATSANTGFGSMAAAGGDTGASATFTLDTGCTLAGSYIVTDIDLDHSRIAAAAKTTLSLKNSADITTPWATS